MIPNQIPYLLVLALQNNYLHPCAYSNGVAFGCEFGVCFDTPVRIQGYLPYASAVCDGGPG